ncbi:histone acetyltransferase, ELP3 family protein, putative [Babesia bigemina]|uniref:tRNA carboxymethyluridine synthase n=1 Tax=Babesia bigemina TaxID=5866 RepID=A0A061CZR9_BABBI|nr:histone acetyltransferase, ELP3 family protein, putative [Babesia bigemina]CDR93908.1 histone acetyltransferase, ELP3 family protein, putative [Babesia bigemina]|eukprot:XP_012766094.1 histone acetyltransferase, ELP3 family protein, putative [Babesia bigemina]
MEPSKLVAAPADSDGGQPGARNFADQSLSEDEVSTVFEAAVVPDELDSAVVVEHHSPVVAETVLPEDVAKPHIEPPLDDDVDVDSDAVVDQSPKAYAEISNDVADDSVEAPENLTVEQSLDANGDVEPPTGVAAVDFEAVVSDALETNRASPSRPRSHPITNGRGGIDSEVVGQEPYDALVEPYVVDGEMSPTSDSPVVGIVPPSNTPIQSMRVSSSTEGNLSFGSSTVSGGACDIVDREVEGGTPARDDFNDYIPSPSRQPAVEGSGKHDAEGENDSDSDSEEEMRNFFPATRESFKEVAGKVTRVTRADFGDSNRRRHLECFARSMDSWRNFESKANQDPNASLYTELQFDRYDDIFVDIDVSTLSTLDQFIYELLSSSENVKDQDELNLLMSKLRRQYHIGPSKRDIFERLLQLQMEREAKKQSSVSSTGSNGSGDFVAGRSTPTSVKYDPKMQHLLRNKGVRSNSGVVVITVLTAPGNFSCSSDCYYCPNEPGQPRSYLSTEPAVLRANQNDFDAARQFYDRAMTLYRNGHVIDKIEVLVLGGTWSGYPRQYQEEFCRDLYYAANVFPTPLEVARPRESLESEQEMNVGGLCRIIGLTLETRPDRITPTEIRILRNLGCTRVQLGIQHTNDDVLNHVNRGHGLDESKRALYLLKENCYKVDVHLMPDLPSSNPDMDREMFALMLGDEGLQADQWKIYPCEVTPFSQIEQWHKQGLFVPYFDTDPNLLMDLLMSVKRAVHPWIRLNRVIRDIPNPSIIAGTNVTNLRQLLLNRMQKCGLMCRCIRCREMKKGSTSLGAKLMVREYRATGGTEYFLSYESQDESKIFGFLRLRLRDNSDFDPKVSTFRCLEGCAFIRELHVYGVVVAHGKAVKEATPYQHRGIGASLLLVAEILAGAKGFRKMAVIAGIGTREYYAKHGYEVEDTFMTKMLDHESIRTRFLKQMERDPSSSIQIPYSIKVNVIDLQDAVRTLHLPLPPAFQGKNPPPVVSVPTSGPYFHINVLRFLRYASHNFDAGVDYTKATTVMFDEYFAYVDRAAASMYKSLQAIQERRVVAASVAFLAVMCYTRFRQRSKM